MAVASRDGRFGGAPMERRGHSAAPTRAVIAAVTAEEMAAEEGAAGAVEVATSEFRAGGCGLLSLTVERAGSHAGAAVP
jgi:hypothetical protein